MPWNDVLEIIQADSVQFSSSGLPIPGSNESNLCLRAYHLLKEDFNIGPIHIHLHKMIPMGAGLGGGSSDAAWTLRVLNDIFSLQLSPSKLMDYAARLGSDCSFFIQDKPMIGSGRGEILSPCSINLKGKWIVLIKPDVHVSTAEAYAGVIPQEPKDTITDLLTRYAVSDWKDRLTNDFEKTVFKKYPLIAELKETLYAHGAEYASMSGSGSTVFGIFNERVDLGKLFPGMLTWFGKL